MIYLILAIVILALLLSWAVKGNLDKKKKIEKAEARATAAELKAEKIQKDVEQVLDFDNHDALLVKQRDEHVAALVKTKSKGVTENEIKGLMFNLRDAYSSLPN